MAIYFNFSCLFVILSLLLFLLTESTHGISPDILQPTEDVATCPDFRYAASLITNVTNFKELVDSEKLPVETIGKTPLTMGQYSRLLGACRVPHEGRDLFKTAGKGKSNSVTVIHNGQVFDLKLYQGHHRLTEKELILQLEKILEASPDRDRFPFGVLTTLDRVTWAKTYEMLTKDPRHASNVEKIINSEFVLCLDKDWPQTTTNPALNEDQDSSVTINNCLHGGGSSLNSCNRWFDKIIQFIVTRDGHVGCCWEHSGPDGPPVQTLCNYVIKNSGKSSETTVAPNRELDPPQKLKWHLTPELKEQIILAADTVDRLVGDFDMRWIKYKGCGKNIPKRYKLSPDAFFQIGLQLAYYRLHGHFAATWESVSIRKFKYGRTDIVRTLSLSAAEFCKAMDRRDKTDGEKTALMRKAIQDHSKLTKEAMDGKAIDRHLLGLGFVAAEMYDSLPEFFRDKGFTSSRYWQLSTSQVPSPLDTVVCFGPLVEDGYGICYNPMETQFNVSVSSFISNPDTNTEQMAESLSRSLDDMQRLLMSTAKL